MPVHQSFQPLLRPSHTSRTSPTTGARRSRQTGFAYLWVLLLVAFMGLGLTVAVQVDSTSAQRDRERELLALGRQFRAAIAQYHETPSGNGAKHEYPSSLDDLLLDPRAPGTLRHLRKVFVDPMTGKAEWGLVLVAGRVVGVHSLSEKMPIKQDGFDFEDQTLRQRARYADWLFTYPADMQIQATRDQVEGDPDAQETEGGE